MSASRHRVRPLTRPQAMHRLGSAAVGRVLFTRHGLPVIRFVPHILDNGEVIIWGDGGEFAGAGAEDRGGAVGYETDDIDPATGTGWTVTIAGPAKLVTDHRRAARYREGLRPWAADGRNDIISICPRLVTGCEISAAASPPARSLAPLAAAVALRSR